MASTKSRSRLFLSVIIFSLGIGVFFMIRGCTSDVSPITANILLKKNGKHFLLTQVSGELTGQLIENGKTPAVTNSTLIYKDGDEVYMNPLTLKPLVAMLRGSYTVYPMKDGSVDGYVSLNKDDGVKEDTEFKSTQKLGEQHQVHQVQLNNGKGKKMWIKWTYNPKESTFYNMKNCEVHGFWTETHPAPGETVWSTTNYLVVPLSTLAVFFDAAVEYDSESELLILQP